MAAVPGSMLPLRGQLREGDKSSPPSVLHGVVQENTSFFELVRYMMFSGEALSLSRTLRCRTV